MTDETIKAVRAALAKIAAPEGKGDIGSREIVRGQDGFGPTDLSNPFTITGSFGILHGGIFTFDGIPDDWESTHGLNPQHGDDGPRVSKNGYTHVENYLNELAGDRLPGNIY